MKILRICLALILLPVCVAGTQSVIALLVSTQTATLADVSPAAWALLVGFGLWLCLYWLLPRPVRAYVLAHELTHALWAWLSGSKVHRIRLSKSGGSVSLSRTSVFITLAPYFCPLYTVLVILLYFGGSLFYDLSPYHVFWIGLVGLTWGFHVTFTVSALMQDQTDVRQYGRLFSYVIIYLCNVLAVGLLLVLLSPSSIGQLLHNLVRDILGNWAWCAHRLWMLVTWLTGRLTAS